MWSRIRNTSFTSLVLCRRRFLIILTIPSEDSLLHIHSLRPALASRGASASSPAPWVRVCVPEAADAAWRCGQTQKSLGVMGVGWRGRRMHSSHLFCFLPLPRSGAAPEPPIGSPPEGRRRRRRRTSCSRCDGLNRMNAGNLNHVPPVFFFSSLFAFGNFCSAMRNTGDAVI